MLSYPSCAFSYASAPQTQWITWYPRADLAQAPAGAWRNWLQERGSLTQRLQRQAQEEFHVQVLHQHLHCLSAQEWAALNRPHRARARELVLVRQVLLYVDHQPWVYARSLLPLCGSAQLYQRIQQLGHQALGQLLFRSPEMKRSAFRFCSPHFFDFPRLADLADVGASPKSLAFTSLWGRCSMFTHRQTRLWVEEHFLPAMAMRLGLQQTAIPAPSVLKSIEL